MTNSAVQEYKWFLILVLETESLEGQRGMLETQRKNENTSNVFPFITISLFLSQDYVLFNYGVEKAGSCLCNVHVISVVWRGWRLRRRWPEGSDGSCGRPAGFLTCQGAAMKEAGRDPGPAQEDLAYKGWMWELPMKKAGGSFCALNQGNSPKLLSRTLKLCVKVPQRAYFHFSSFCCVWKELGFQCRVADSDWGRCRQLDRCYSLSTS